MKIKDREFRIDFLILFQWIWIIKESDDDLKNFLKYKIAPFSLSLFTEEGMHKDRKSMVYLLYAIFTPVQEPANSLPKWMMVRSKSRESTFQFVWQNYEDYFQGHFASSAIVDFDEYPVGISYQSTKADVDTAISEKKSLQPKKN